MSVPAVHTTILGDQDARDLIRTDLARNVMVLAGAGAGKTYALVDRMVAAVRTGAAEIERIAAITFTRKAAGEMRGRFYRRLRESRHDANTAVEAERIDRAIEKIDQCFIGTIHAFCGRVLRERPLEAGLAPDFEEIEDRDESQLRRKAWDAFVQERFSADDQRLAELEDHGIAPEDLYPFFGERCHNSDIPLKKTLTLRPSLLPAAARVEAFVDEVMAYIPPGSERRDKLMTAVRRARHFIDNHGVATDRDAARLLLMFDSKLRVTLKLWTDKSAAREIRDERLPNLQDSTVKPALRVWRECAYRLVASFVDDAVVHYDRLRQELGKVTFQDLLLRTAALLRDHPDVRRYIQQRFRTLLVDEFQDTDPVQAEILFYLSGTDVNERDWTRLEPRPGSLFLVGDDKQSIYRFRRADVEIFRFAARRIEETGGAVVRLNTSFRSLGTLCKWISRSFAPIFARASAPYQAPFEPLLQHRPDGVDPHCVRKITVRQLDRRSRAGIAANDAERIGNFILGAVEGRTSLNDVREDALLSNEASPGDFLILTRTTAQLKVYADALERRGIPYDISGGRHLGTSEEVATIVTMLRAIYVPEDPIPFVSYLRGPLVGMSDPDLYALRKAGVRLSVGAVIPEALEEGLRSRFQDALMQLHESEADLTARPPGAAIERILERTGYLGYASIHPGGGASSRAGNLLRLLAMVRHFSGMGWAWGRIVEELHALVADRAYDIEEMTLEMGMPDAVRIMNLHQAKGLQAPVVFLADPYDMSFDKEPRRHVSRSPGGAYLSMSVSKPKGDFGHEIVAQPVGWDADKDEEALFAAAEEIRLLYVAATRARNLLIVSQYEPKPDTGPWSPLHHYLRDVPELEIVPVNLPVHRNAKDSDYSVLREAARRRIRKSKRPSYTERTVSGGGEVRTVDFEISEGRGRDYGAVVHAIFEDAVLGKIPDAPAAYVEEIIAKAGLQDDLARDATGALDRLRTSVLWQELQEADRVHTEVPIGAIGESGDPVRGVIDLVYKHAGTWKIVDYKTDVAVTQADVERLRLKYDVQVQEYARHWRAITGEPVERASIWFVHGPSSVRQFVHGPSSVRQLTLF